MTDRVTSLLKDILGTTTKVATWLKAVAIGLFVLCVVMSFHYLFLNFPRKIDTTSVSFDYVGILIAVFGILITILVGWQIYSTIRVRDELSLEKKEIEKKYHTSFLQYREKLDVKVEKLDKKMEESELSLKYYVESLLDYSLASLRRQTFLVIEDSKFDKFCTPLLNDCFVYLKNALENINKTPINDNVNQICQELLTLTNNVIERKKWDGIIKYIDEEIINAILLNIDKISIDVIPTKNTIIKNLEEIKLLLPHVGSTNAINSKTTK